MSATSVPTIDEAKVVYFPMPMTTRSGEAIVGDDGEQRVNFVKLGVRVIIGKHTFFHSFKHKTWTRRIPGPMKRYSSLTPITDTKGNAQYEDDRVFKYKDLNDIKKRLSTPLYFALSIGFQAAIEADEN